MQTKGQNRAVEGTALSGAAPFTIYGIPKTQLARLQNLEVLSLATTNI
jgi:hypothetical protein